MSMFKFRKSLTEAGFHIPASRLVTISSVAINVFKTFFYNKDDGKPIMSMLPSSRIFKFIKEAYYGGRTEVFHSGINLNKVYHFDIPGIYARCMQIPLPYGNPVYIEKITATVEDLFTTLHSNNIIGFFNATVKCPDNLEYPILPNNHSYKLLFNTGTFTSNYTSYELELAIEYGYEITLNTGYIFKTTTSLKRYSMTMTDLKNKASEKGDIVMRAMAKLLSNSLYGKFAASYHDTASLFINGKELTALEKSFEINSRTEISNDMYMVNYNTKPLSKKEVSNSLVKDLVKQFSKQSIPTDINVAISATITSYGRIILYRLLIDVIAKGGKVCYTDTDRVFASFEEAPFGKVFREFT